jgi:hypothetical protein
MPAVLIDGRFRAHNHLDSSDDDVEPVEKHAEAHGVAP